MKNANGKVLEPRAERRGAMTDPGKFKHWFTRVAGCWCAVFLLSLCARAQYSIDWFTIDNGGGASSGGGYSLNGTVGQHDASQSSSGGNYLVSGGFWALFAVQTPGAPLLSIKLTTTNTVQVYWASPSAGWNLQANTDIATTTWVTPPEAVQDNGTIKFIIVDPPAGNRFYRLKNP